MNYMLRSTIFLFQVICFCPVLSYNNNNNNKHYNNNNLRGGPLLFQQEPINNNINKDDFRFTQTFYNASVAENSVGSTMVLPTLEKMGIWNPHGRKIEYTIVSGDPLRMFLVEPRQVGDFCFLMIRVNANDRILNREFRELYKVQIKGVVHKEEETSSVKDKEEVEDQETATADDENWIEDSGGGRSRSLLSISDGGSASFWKRKGGGNETKKHHWDLQDSGSSSGDSSSETEVENPISADVNANLEIENDANFKRTSTSTTTPVAVDDNNDDVNGLPETKKTKTKREKQKKGKNKSKRKKGISIDSESFPQDHLQDDAAFSSSSFSSSENKRGRNKLSPATRRSQATNNGPTSMTTMEEEAEEKGRKEKNRLIQEIPALSVQNDQLLVVNDQYHHRQLPVVLVTAPSVVHANTKRRRTEQVEEEGGDDDEESYYYSSTTIRPKKKKKKKDRSVSLQFLPEEEENEQIVQKLTRGEEEEEDFAVDVNKFGRRNRTNNNKNNNNDRILRRNLRDSERKSKSRNRNKSGERRKNRKDKQIISPIGSKIPEQTSVFGPPPPPPPRQMSTVATTTTTTTTKSPPKVPILETSTIVYIAVIDVDDNNPIHEYSNYDIVVSEDAPILSKVTKISAADADIGKNQEIYYSIPDWNNYWSIDPITGVLSPIRPLSRESSQQQIHVRAKNRWNSASASNPGSIATVNISIRPVNRHAPQIHISRPPQVETRSVNGVIYAVAAIRDQDEGENGLVDLEIKEGDPNGIFRIGASPSRNEFYIEMSPIVAKSFELKGHKSQSFNLTIRATDRGTPSKSTEKDLQIRVNGAMGGPDKNLNGAIFDKNLYEVEIPETSPPHSVVFRFKRPESKVHLSISSGNEGDDFYLEEKSGVLYTSKWLDAETKSSYTLTIDSRDRRPGRMDSSRIRQSVAKIVVKIRDMNDNPPIPRISFPNNSSEIFINENEPIGTKVAKITARDLDQGENGYVTYNIANLKPIPFSIDHFTGEIRTTESLDYETSRRKYTLRIRASDWGQPSRRESEITIVATLKNINDNRPVNLLTNCIAVIDRNIKFETEFGKLEAIDFDRSDVVFYRIIGGNEDQCFGIDQYSGKLKVMCDLRDLRATKRYINITASDGEYYSDVMTVKVELSDGLRSNFNKSDSVKSGIKLFSTSQSVFECQDTGVRERFERMAALSEENNKVDESDFIDDGFAPLPSRYGENIHPPQITAIHEIDVNESTEVGTSVLTLKGRDMDKGYNGLLTFVISNGDEVHGAWDIIVEPTTSVAGGGITQEARLVIARPLDREEIPYYVLNITVWDQGKPPKQMSKLLTIKVADTNDQKPIFLKPAMKIKFGEGNQLVGEALLQVTATDGDEPGTPNSEISYRLLNDFPEFSIDEKSGIIKLVKDLDRERQSVYELLVIAEDHGTPTKLSSIAVVTIIVEDKNDCAPKFESNGAYKYRIAKIREDWPVGAVVTRIFAKDEDIGLAGTVRYALVDGDKGDFALDEISGVIRVLKDLDYGVTSIYNLTIRARDLGSPSLETENFVVVEIFNVQRNSQPFSFSDIVATAEIPEDAPVGSIVTTVAPRSSEVKHPGMIFSLEGSTRFLFSIDHDGVLRTAHSLDHETLSSHWVAVLARNMINGDQARLEVFIRILDVNECIPLTTEPMYTRAVAENSDAGLSVLQVEAFDCDDNGGFHFAIKGSNPHFEIHPKTGQIITTGVPLDREKFSEHTFDVIVTDLGTPPLSSTTKIVIRVLDQNDMAPTFFIRSGSMHKIPELRSDLLQGDEPTDYNSVVGDGELESEDFEDALKWSEWQVIDFDTDMVNAEGWKKIYRVVAFDGDAMENGTVTYRLKYRVSTGSNSRDDEVFSIHPQTGEIYTSANVVKNNTVLKFVIEASDQGTPVPLKNEIELLLKVQGINKRTSSTPLIRLPSDQVVTITTKERPGSTVETIDAIDPEGEQLWYEIVAGDPEQNFILLPDSQNLILARPVLKEQEFRLNISVSDGSNNVFTQLLVRVIETERVSSLIWEQESYTAYIHENSYDFSTIVRVGINVSVSTNWTGSSSPVLYGFHNAQDIRSVKLFTIDSLTGDVSIAKPNEIDRETLPQHILTVKARDPQQLYSFVRLIVNVLDSNDVSPIFPSGIHGSAMRAEVRIPETTAVGTLITQIEAFDMDEGENGRLSYALTFGNTGNTFGIDKETGWLYLNRPLLLPPGDTSMEYVLTVTAFDNGDPPLSATTNVNVVVTLSSDDQVLALRCDADDVDEKRSRTTTTTTAKKGRAGESWVHIRENSLPGTYVTAVRVDNSISVSFEIEDNNRHMFWIDSTTGVILVGKNKGLLDRETKATHDISVRATNLRGLTATCKIHVVLLDVNDNSPAFLSVYYEGQISEAAPLGTLVMEKVVSSPPPTSDLYYSGGENLQVGAVDQNKPLVLHSIDLDVGKNALVTYSIIEDEEMRTVFHVDPSTGALLLVTPLDYEKRSRYVFHVRAVDEGGLMSSNIAVVNVSVLNVNDVPPACKSARVELLIPTVKGLLVHTVEAKDADGDPLEFNITRGNMQGFFQIEKKTGHIRIAKPENFVSAKHVLEVSVNDGKFTTVATINIHVKVLETNPRFAFRNSTFVSSAVENSTKIVNLLSLSVIGADINEGLRFSILNPTPFFGIMQTSGVIFTLGRKLDREEEPLHNLLVEVRGDGSNRIARCFVRVIVSDINDSPPQFLHLPYVAVISVDAKPGDSVIQVKAFDADEGENAVVRFELVRSPYGDIYDLDKNSGQVSMRRKMDGVGHHEITIKAYDGGIPTLTTETTIAIKIVSRDMPVFEQQWYETWIPEDAAISSTALALVAHAKNPIMYSIEAGNEYDEFGIDYQTDLGLNRICVLYVNAPLDFEAQTTHRLTIRATDLSTSSWSSTIVTVRIRDSNDCRPRFERAVYNIRLTEGYMPPNGIVTILKAHDNDTGINAVLTYEMAIDDVVVVGGGRRRGESENTFPRRNPRDLQEDNEDEDSSDGEDDAFSGDSSSSSSESATMTETSMMMSEDATSNNRSLDASRWFLIKPNDGAIVLKQVLDYERFHELRFSVIVKDSGIPSLSSTARVVIDVVGINDESPVFEKSVYTARISEQAGRGHIVAQITAFDPDLMDVLRYAIVGYYHNKNAFDINEKTGLVTVAQPKLLLTELSFILNISVTDGVFTSFTRLHIDVEPTNHNAPSFSSLIYEVGCREDSPDGHLIATLSAVDPDRSVFGDVRFFLADTDEPGLFVVNENTGEVRLSSTPDASLDREYKESHTLEIAAQDGGGWLGFTKLAVKIIGVNEFPPVFVCSEYRVTIPSERMRSKNPILQVIAVDADTEFGIRYSIVDLPAYSRNSTMKRDSNYFEMNEETGEVRFKMSEDDVAKFGIDRVDFQFFSVASDEGGLHSQVPVTVVVLPQGQVVPEIQPQNATFFVKEDTPVGSMVTTFHVTNIDSPRFRVVSSNEEFFQVDNHGNLLISARLDQEQEDKHTVVIWAESADGSSVATSQVTIRVLDSNDNPPTFNAQQYNIKVAENFPEGSLIFTVHALDADKSRNVKQRYSLVPSGSPSETSHFSVNQEHGWITLLTKLDYEMNTVHTLHVVATDSEKPHLMSTCTVIVEVLNVNDNKATFDTGHYYSSVREDVPEGALVATVHTTDLDDVRGGNTTTTITPSYLAFYIVGGNEKGHFKITDRGEISVWRTLDAEVDQKFELRILATDGFYTDYADVTVNIIDVNDNLPVCPIPEYEQHLLESVKIGEYVATIEAQDPDINGPNPIFSLSGAGADDFEIDPDTGIISTRNSLDRESKRAFYSLTVHAEDRESRLECTSVLRIFVLDINDNKPLFTENSYTMTVKEDAQIGALIGKTHADDLDGPINRKLRYSLVSTIANSDTLIDNQFTVDSSSGVISLLRPLDRELVSHYNLSIQATDGGTPPQTNTVAVYVIVLDINDNSPEFMSSYYSTSISELATVSTEVTRVMATSKDINENADISYKIVGGNGYNHFGIHPKTGVIFVNASLDYEKVREYVLAVRAQDAGIPPLASQCLVNVTVVDFNDNSPQFSSTTYSVQVAEDAPISTSVIRVQANDLDSGVNSIIDYEIVSGDRLKHFQIDPSKGVISVASALDREMISHYSLEIRATDHGVPPLSSTIRVETAVLDLNDNAPFFENNHEQYSAIVQEDRPIGYAVLSFVVSDADSPPNSAPFTWDLKDLEAPPGTPLLFTVSDAGTLNVAGKLNFQRKNLYRLQVRVFDNGNPPLFSDANVTIKVVDKSQWPPVVSSLTVTAITADETYPAGIPLGEVHASDFDPYDTLSYSLLETQSSSIFKIDPFNGTLKSLIPLREGTYELGIGVSDGRWTARGEAHIKIITLGSLIPEYKSESNYLLPDTTSSDGKTSSSSSGKLKTVKKSRKDISAFAIVMTLSGHNPQSLLTRIFGLISVVKEAMGVEPTGLSPYDVFILSVQSTKFPLNQSSVSALSLSSEESGGGGGRMRREADIPSVDVLLAVRKSMDRNFVPPSELIKKLRFALPQIEAILQGRVVQLTYDICKADSCDHGQCRTLATFEGTQSLIATETLSLITPNHELETTCLCSPGYGGTKCEKVINACAHSECMAGYICVPDSSVKGYACLCRKTYCSPDGNCEDQCAQQSVSFSGTSFLAYNVGPSLERELSISLRVKTLYTTGTLLHTYGHFDYALLEIKQGLVQFSWDLGTGKEVLTVTSISVSDNRWHRILLQIRDNYAILRVDERSTQKQKSQGPARSLHTGGVIYIGARIIGTLGGTLESLIPAQGFIGCMKDLRYGYIFENSSNNMKKPSEMQIQEVKHYITPNHNRINAEIDDAILDEEEDELDPDPRNARMPPLPLHTSDKDKSGSHLMWSRNISFSCERILHVVEACKSLPCANGGTCYADRTVNGYRCDCPSRFHGLNCEIDLDPCSESPCLNSGKCTPTTSSPISFSPSLVGSGGDLQDPQFYCHCVDGTYGFRCERGRWCKGGDLYGESEVCNRRGDCEDGPIGPICWCEKGYTGSSCQLDVNECERGDACGAGSTCVNFQGGFRCLCPSNATGTRCNRLLTAPSIVATDYQELILIVVGVFFLLILLIVFIFVRRCCIARERNAASNTIPLTSSHSLKDKDNRIPMGRDNREQVLRNRDSKISNLEVRPVSATSDLCSEMRSPLDPIKSYGSAGDDLEKPPPFINNLMKGTLDKKRIPGQASCWETNRDDYAKVQNYMKDEINWASKGSKPSSPVSTGASSGYHWDHSDLSQPANISPTRTLPPPPPDLPDSLSIISHDSNTEVPSINLAALPPIDSTRDMDTLVELLEEEDPSRLSMLDEGTSCDEGGGWPIPHPDQYLLAHHHLSEGGGTDTTDPEDNSHKPIAISNRYKKKGSNHHQNHHHLFNNQQQSSSSQICEISDDEINENSHLLSPTAVLNPNVVVSSHHHNAKEPPPPVKARNFANKQSTPSSSSATSTTTANHTNSMNGNNGNSNANRKNFSKTTHVTQV